MAKQTNFMEISPLEAMDNPVFREWSNVCQVTGTMRASPSHFSIITACSRVDRTAAPGGRDEATRINQVSWFVGLVGPCRFDRAGLRRSSLTTSERRQRRTIGKSCDRIKKPRGIIQKPRIGKNPKKPPIIRPAPNATRTGARAGRPMVLRPTRISPRAALKLKALFFAI
ncbi:hypothetical protein OEG84_05050 [Hoeflea sp. G2-23]|uniref:Uncharacterized protein n=1 Tax=Hoeflea algicola TaxID=2983763 RepID=A0ABT3Z5Q6_9HYPH|nr:hypothetical protein [Hoeflea algicola]MCY0147099.1 hypothetical protein [Hoeflea algicola]